MAKVFDSTNGMSIEKRVAVMAGSSVEMDQTAGAIESTMKAEAAKHVDSGTFEDSIKTVKDARGKDRVVGSTDPLAVPKEFGHVMPNGTYVPGMHVLWATINSLPKV